jgi:hypothetical protein
VYGLCTRTPLGAQKVVDRAITIFPLPNLTEISAHSPSAVVRTVNHVVSVTTEASQQGRSIRVNIMKFSDVPVSLDGAQSTLELACFLAERRLCARKKLRTSFRVVQRAGGAALRVLHGRRFVRAVLENGGGCFGVRGSAMRGDHS